MSDCTEHTCPQHGEANRPPGDLVDAQAIATAYPVAESTIRTWAARGWLTKYPQGHRKRTLYSLSEFARLFTEKSACRTRFGKQ